jgi:hypothetical protein
VLLAQSSPGASSPDQLITGWRLDRLDVPAEAAPGEVSKNAGNTAAAATRALMWG